MAEEHEGFAGNGIRKNVFSMIFSFSMNSMLRFFVPVLLPFFIVSLHITVYLGSLLVTVYWLGYTIMQIPSGIISDRIGVSKVSKFSFLIMAIIFSIFYFSKISYLLLAILQFLLGSISATVYVSDTSVVQKSIPYEKRATYVGIYQTGFFIGASLGEYAILSTFNISFMTSYIFILSFLSIAAILNFIFVKEPVKIGIKTKGKIDKRIAYVAMIRFAAGFIYIGFITLFTTFIVYDHIVPYSSAYLYAWIPAAGGLITSPFGGIISRKLKRGKSFVSIFPVILLDLVLIFINYVPVFTIFSLSFLTGMLYGLYAGPSMSMASDFSGSDSNLAASSSILNFSSQIGGTVSPLIIGLFFSIYGNFNFAFELIAIISLILIIIPLIKLKI